MTAIEYFYEIYLGRSLRDNEKSYLNDVLNNEIYKYGIMRVKYRRHGTKPQQVIKIDLK